MVQKVIEVNADLTMQSMFEKEASIGPVTLGPLRIHYYDTLINKPKLNGITIVGDQRFQDFGITFCSYDDTMATLNS